ncbi:hypothetical protein C9439_00485 [archaeon SCG-AAA382B04]|nr:hypothetical protein C9439_00485 [archaeon SCG-AAA382B04]
MKILLINPACEKSWFEFHPKKKSYSFHTTGSSPPLGLLYIATNLKDQEYNVDLIDNDAERLSEREILEYIEKNKPKIVGFSALVGTSENAHSLAKKIKEKYPKILILYGGPLATNFPKKLMKKYEFIDYILKGEAEETIITFLERLENKESVNNVNGIVYREKGEIIADEEVPIVKDLNTLVTPKRSLLKKEYDLSFPLGNSEVRLSVDKYTPILTSRGCPNNCNFCLSEKNSWRPRSPEDVVNEIEKLHKKGYGHFFFIDNNFGADKERAKKICDLIIEKDLDIYWCAQLSANTGNYELFAKMKKAGCEGLLLGIESVNRDILDYYDKPLKPDLAKKMVDLARKSGINVIIGTFMIGAPDETKKEAKKTLEFAKELDIDGLVISKLTLKPHTTLWNEMKEKGYLTEDLIDDRVEETIKQHEVKSRLSKEQLDSLIDSTYSEFIKRPSFIIKTIKRMITSEFRRKWVYINSSGILLYLKEKLKDMF